jgi:phage shock protein PspC (stress-responsive transcriptional regulator)
VLHAPSRWIYLTSQAPLILAVISMGTRWLTELYKKHGLVGSIAGHAVYNGMLSWLVALILAPWVTIATFIVMILAYIRVSTAKL